MVSLRDFYKRHNVSPFFTLFSILFALSICIPAFSSDSYFITLQKLELKKDTGEWVTVIEPDHKIDLAAVEPTLSFFNNGRVPEGGFVNFKVTFNDHGKTRQLFRKQDVTNMLIIKKGSYVRAAFLLDTTEIPGKVKELRLTVDEDNRIDLEDSIGHTIGEDIIMVLTPSLMTRLGSAAPEFELKDVVSGLPVSLSSFASKELLLVMFICRHCPYVQHVKSELTRLDKDYLNKNIALVAVSANDADNYPDDAPDRLKEMAVEEGWHFPFLYDESQEVARAYNAKCTPDFFLYDRQRQLIYRGQLDDSRPDNGKPLTGKDLRQAIDAALAGQAVSLIQKPSIGCNIKWKKTVTVNGE